MYETHTCHVTLDSSGSPIESRRGSREFPETDRADQYQYSLTLLKWLTFSRRHFHMNVRPWKSSYFESDFIDTVLVYFSIWHYSDVIMDTVASQITSLSIVYSTVYSGADQRKHQSSASLAFVRGTHRWAVNSPHKWPVTRKMFPFDDVIMFRTNRQIPMKLSLICRFCDVSLLIHLSMLY